MKKLNIKNMNLYKSTSRFVNNYNNLKNKLNRKPTINELSEFDHLHYNGKESVDQAIKNININHLSKVLDIGSGIGGPARYIAEKTNAQVLAIELQKDLNEIASYITSSYNINNNIKHIHADFLKYDFKKIKVNKVVSWLALYHMPDRNRLLKKINNLLVTNGFFFAEDFFLIKPLNTKKINYLANVFYANHLVTYDQYISELTNNNFKVIETEIMSKNWTLFTKKRLVHFKKNLQNNLKTQGKNTVDNILNFYSLAYELLASKTLGGLRYIVKKEA